jgi:hypothetical protein
MTELSVDDFKKKMKTATLPYRRKKITAGGPGSGRHAHAGLANILEKAGFVHRHTQWWEKAKGPSGATRQPDESRYQHPSGRTATAYSTGAWRIHDPSKVSPTDRGFTRGSGIAELKTHLRGLQAGAVPYLEKMLYAGGPGSGRHPEGAAPRHQEIHNELTQHGYTYAGNRQPSGNLKNAYSVYKHPDGRQSFAVQKSGRWDKFSKSATFSGPLGYGHGVESLRSHLKSANG